MSGRNPGRTETITDDPVDIRSSGSNSLAFIVRGSDPVAVVGTVDDTFDDGGKVHTGETYKATGLRAGDQIIVVCDTGDSSDIDIFEGGVG